MSDQLLRHGQFTSSKESAGELVAKNQHSSQAAQKYNLCNTYLFKSISKQTRPRGPHSIVKSLKPICKEYLARKSVFKRKVNLSEHEHYIFVEIITNKPTNSPVSPPTMAQ